MVKRRRSNSSLWIWGSIGVVVAVVATIVAIATLGGNGGPEQTYFGPTSATILHEVTSVPASVFNTVGVNSEIQVTGPALPKTAQPPLTDTVGGVTKPEAFYWGAQYCPYCAATRWGIIVALSRFGTFNKLYDMLSSSSDVFPNTPTFTFVGKKPTDDVVYSSKYFVFKSFEVQDRNHKTFQVTPQKETKLVLTYNQGQSFPFMDMGNKVFIISTAFLPSELDSYSRAQIASGLTDANLPITQAIISTANFVSAGLCSMIKDPPADVCNSSGVKAAAAAIGLKL